MGNRVYVAGFGVSSRAGKWAALVAVAAVLAGCSIFGGNKIKEEPIIPAETLYSSALSNMDARRYDSAVASLKKLERQHPYSDYNEKAKLLEVYANYRIGKFGEAILAADRYLALFPGSPEVAYVLFLKGSSFFAQIVDVTRDQQLARDAIDTYTLLIANYPQSDYAKDARKKITLAIDQLAGKEMSVGRYYAGNGRYVAAINRFRVVADKYQTSTHVEEALYRLVESNLALGLIREAQTAAGVLGHNYPASAWYARALDILKKGGVMPSPGSAVSPGAASRG